MKDILNSTRLLIGSALAIGILAGTATAQDPLTIDTYETAGINGRYWDRQAPDADAFDAVFRSLLIRFPDSAEAIAARLSAGERIERAEVELDYGGHETNAPNYYMARTAIGDNLPQWHVIAYPLRRPWTATPGELAPTFNAYLSGAGYWAKYGAQDEQADRHPTRLGPAELSHAATTARLDITALLTEDAYGPSAGERIRAFEERGLLLRKWEMWDHRYNDWTSYEWRTATGGNALKVESARLVVHFQDGPAEQIELPPAVDHTALAEQLKRDGTGGEPTAIVPDEARLREIAERARPTQPEWMPDWQWERLQVLRELGGGYVFNQVRRLSAADPEEYDRLIHDTLRVLPRLWRAWAVQDDLVLWYVYRDLLPAPLRDHKHLYWQSWLYPDTPTDELMSPHATGKMEWWEEHRDWRGRASFFRNHYTRRTGTVGFNHTSSMGALLGGAIVDSEHAMEDARAGMPRTLLRTHTFDEGSNVEFLDHYYFSIVLSAQKMFVDFGPTVYDRLIGQVLLDRSLEILTSAHHPQLRRPVQTTGRGRMSAVFGFEQEGMHALLHFLSPEGVLMHTEDGTGGKRQDIHLFGYDVPPGRLFIQSLTQPWTVPWVHHMIDDKPMPWYETAAQTYRQSLDPPSWRRVYLGRTYGLASNDARGTGRSTIMGHWSAYDEPLRQIDDLRTLTARFALNEPSMMSARGNARGGLMVLQDRNRALIVTRPIDDKEEMVKLAGDDGLTELSTVVALWKFEDELPWTIRVNGEAVDIDSLPLELEAGQRIVVQDGDTFIGMIALPGTDLGREASVVLRRGDPEPLGDHRHPELEFAPHLLVQAFNLKSETPLAEEDERWDRIISETFGGFVVEMSDSSEHADIDAFDRHLAEAELDARMEDGVAHVRYISGGSEMEFGVGTGFTLWDHFPITPGKQEQLFSYRRIDGEWAYLEEGMERDTPLSQQGVTGRLEKNGAVLEMEPGRKMYLMTEPITGSYTGYNPYPELSPWQLTVGEVIVRADGQLGLARISVRPSEGKLWIDQAYTEQQLENDEIARRLLVFGLDAAPEVILNGEALEEALATEEIDGRTAYVIPLSVSMQ